MNGETGSASPRQYLPEVLMKALKSMAVTPYHPQPVWCHHCCIRIAPYDPRTVAHGKDYHRDCYAKVLHAQAKSSRR